MKCNWCGVELLGRHRRFCSIRCARKWHKVLTSEKPLAKFKYKPITKRIENKYLLDNDDPVLSNELRSCLDTLLSKLSFREREIVKLRYGLEDGHCATLQEAGRLFKVTQERVRQIEAKAVRKLQRSSLRAISIFKDWL